MLLGKSGQQPKQEQAHAMKHQSPVRSFHDEFLLSAPETDCTSRAEPGQSSDQ
jgi:hypothetical protein